MLAAHLQDEVWDLHQCDSDPKRKGVVRQSTSLTVEDHTFHACMHRTTYCRKTSGLTLSKISQPSFNTRPFRQSPGSGGANRLRLFVKPGLCTEQTTLGQHGHAVRLACAHSSIATDTSTRLTDQRHHGHEVRHAQEAGAAEHNAHDVLNVAHRGVGLRQYRSLVVHAAVDQSYSQREGAAGQGVAGGAPVHQPVLQQQLTQLRYRENSDSTVLSRTVQRTMECSTMLQYSMRQEDRALAQLQRRV